MPTGIFHLQDDGKLIEMTEQPYDSEDWLQRALVDYPGILAGDQISTEDPRRWILISREMGVPDAENAVDRWSLDHLLLDQDAIPTLIEVKRSSDTRIRREVVGQMLDYASNAVSYWPVERLRDEFETRCAELELAPNQHLQISLGDDIDPEDYWDQVKLNLQAGRIRMLFVADHIPGELRRIVEFLNEQMDPAQVLAVEIKQFRGGGLTSLVPRVLGQTAAAETRKQPGRTRSKKEWDEEAFFAALAQYAPDGVDVARELLRWTREELGEPDWGKGAGNGSFITRLDHKDFRYVLFDAWTEGTVGIRFQRLKKRAPFDSDELRSEMAQRLNAIEGVSVQPEKWPTVKLTQLRDPASLKHFCEVMKWAADQIRAT